MRQLGPARSPPSPPSCIEAYIWMLSRPPVAASSFLPMSSTACTVDSLRDARRGFEHQLLARRFDAAADQADERRRDAKPQRVASVDHASLLVRLLVA